MPLITLSPRSRRHARLSRSRFLQLTKLLPITPSREAARGFVGAASAYGVRPGKEYGDQKGVIGGQTGC